MSWRDGGHDDEDDEPHGLHASESPTALSDYHNSVTTRGGTPSARILAMARSVKRIIDELFCMRVIATQIIIQIKTFPKAFIH